MDDSRYDRRTVLAGAGAAVVGALAGCAEPRAQSTIEGGSSSGAIDVEEGETADGSTYTAVYEAVIDSVTQVRVLGVDNPLTGEEEQGQGSGFVYEDEYVVTNDHVVFDGDQIDLQYINGDWTSTRLVGTDFYSDLAVLEADHVPAEATPLSLSEDRPVQGQEVLAIGNPFGLEGSMTNGIVSGVNRSLRMPNRRYSFPNVVQTDAPVNPGNSGGPLVDMDGDVVGVVNAGGGTNIGFAISAALTSRVVPALIDDGSYDHPHMGISLETVDLTIAEENDLEEATGVIVADVNAGEPADGVLEPADDVVTRHGEPVPVGGDVIVALDDEPIPDYHALATFLALAASPGETITVDLLRNGSETTEELTLGTRPEPDETPFQP